MTEGRTPPHNAEAERQLLGAILLSNDVFYLVADILKPEHFFIKEHRTIYEKSAALIQDGKTASPVTLKTYMGDGQQWAGKTAVQFMLLLVRDSASRINAVDYARQIVDLATRRQMIDLAQSVTEVAYDAPIDTSPNAMIDDLGAQLFQLRPKDASADDSLEGIEAGLTAKIEMILEGKAPPVPKIGISELDRDLGGLMPTNLMLVAARPGMGKTVAGVHIARRAARQKFGVAVFTLEISREQWFSRLVAAEAAMGHHQLYYGDINNGRLTREQFDAYRKYAETARQLPIEVDDTGGLTLGQIEARARVMQQSFERRDIPLGAIVVDYLGLMSAGDRYKGSKVNEVSEISAGLKAMAKKLDTCMIALSQLSRAVESRDNKRPVLSDLRDSGSLEQDADQVVFLYRPAYYDERDPKFGTDAEFTDAAERRANDLEWIISKNRTGPINTHTTYCEIGKAHIAAKSSFG
jgi:replicative DNA helicase